MKLLIEVDFSVDGRLPTKEEKAYVLQRVITEWPNWVYSYGDDDDEGALIANLTCEWK